MSIFSWLGFLVNMAAAGGFVLACVIYAKRIGGVGPWLVASVGVIDALLMLMFRIHSLIGFDHSTRSFAEFEREMLVLESIDALATCGSALLALVGFALMMPRVRR